MSGKPATIFITSALLLLLLLLLLFFTDETRGIEVFVTDTTTSAGVDASSATSTAPADSLPPVAWTTSSTDSSKSREIETTTNWQTLQAVATTSTPKVATKGLRCYDKSNPSYASPYYCRYSDNQLQVTREMDGSGFDVVLPGAFDNQDVQLLILSNLSLKSLDPSSFRGLGSLMTLHLENNEIEVLPLGIFDGLSGLSFLYLDFNGIVELKAGLFDSPKYLKEISLSNNKISVIENGVFEKLEYLEKLQLNGNSLNSSTLNGDTFIGLSTVMQLDLGYNEISTISSEMFKPMNYLKSLNLTRNSIRFVPDYLFTSQIEKLDLSFNVIEDLGDDSFKDRRLLSDIRLNDNQLTHIKKATFDGLDGMITIHLENNRIANLSDSLSGLTQLKNLILRNNSIQVLPLGWTDPLGNLEVVDLSHNVIDKVFQKPFLSPYRLTKIDLSFNRLQTIGDEWFDTTTKLNELNLRGNQLAALPDGVFTTPTQISVLDFGGNRFKQEALNDAFRNLTSLKVLRLDNNSMTSFDADAVGCQALLEELHLNASCLESVRVNGFYNLKRLYLQRNYLQYLGSEDVGGLVALEYLDASDNNITLFDFGSFENSVNLQFLNLSMNIISSVIFSSKFPMNSKGAVFDFSWNPITDLATFPDINKFYLAFEQLPCSCDQLPNWKSAESFGSYKETVCTEGNNTYFLACYLTNTSRCPARPGLDSTILKNWCNNAVPPTGLNTRPIIYKDSCKYPRAVIVGVRLNQTDEGITITWNVTNINSVKWFYIEWSHTSENNTISTGYKYSLKNSDLNYSIKLPDSGTTSVCISTEPVYTFIPKSVVCESINFTAPNISSIIRTSSLQPIKEYEIPFWAWIILAIGLLLLLLLLILIIALCVISRRRKQEKLRQEEEIHGRSAIKRDPSFHSSFNDLDLPQDTAEQAVISMDMYSSTL